MTLSAWVYETANVGDDGQIVAKSDGSSGWQLKSTPDTGPRTFGIAITNSSGGSHPALQQHRARIEYLVSRRRCLRRHCADAEHLRQWRAQQRNAVRHGSDLPARVHRRRQHRAADRGLQHSRHCRRRADLRPSAQCRGDPGRYGHASRRNRRRHDTAVGADQSHRHGGLVRADQPELDRVDRQRRGDRVSDRALPGRRAARPSPRSRPRPGRRTTIPAGRPNTSYSYRVRATDAVRQPQRLLQHRERHDARGGHDTADGADQSHRHGGLVRARST